VTSLVPAIESLRQPFAIGLACIVADRGTISAETIATLEAHGLLDIIGVHERTDKLVREVVLSNAASFVPLVIEKRGRDTEHGAKAVTLSRARYIACVNHQEAANDAAERAAILAASERQLRRGDQALVGNTGYCRFLKTAGKDHFTIDRIKSWGTRGSMASSCCAQTPILVRWLPRCATGSSGLSTRPSAPPSICSPRGRSSTSSTRPAGD
jgi:hypothetical protein